MQSTASKVNAILLSCLYNDSELPKDGSAPKDAVIVKGVVGQFGFNPERLEAARSKVEDIIKEVVADEFLEGKGGGMSFLQLCMDREGQQWAEHRTLDEFCCLAQGLKLASFPLSREFWAVLPGGVPYVVFKNLHETVNVDASEAS